MPSRLYATALDLQDYAKQLVSSSELPRIIRRLVQASEPHLSYLNFPAGASTTTGGWDGTVDGAAGSGKVPAGSSRWELTKKVNSNSKAQSDYEKRAKEPTSFNKKDVTYIHVTLRKWKDKTAWAQDRMTDTKLPSPWKEVRAYDADDLEEWLEQHPAIHAWVSRLIGHRPSHVEDLDDTWSKWCQQTHPAFSPTLLLAGRDEEANHVLKWLDEPPSVLVLQGDTRSEAVAFLAATLQYAASRNEIWDRHMARVLKVKDPETWDHLLGFAAPLVLIPDFEPRPAPALALQAGHHVLLPEDQRFLGESVVLPRLNPKQAGQELLKLGLSRSDVIQHLQNDGGRVSILRRRLAPAGTLPPDWLNPEAAMTLIPAILAGKWQGNQPGDRQALASLSGQDYGTLEGKLGAWSTTADNPIEQEGSLWKVVAKLDSWSLTRHLTQTHMDHLSLVVLQVLGEHDPKYDLPVEDRFASSAYRANLLHSRNLREGLAETLVVMATHDWNSPHLRHAEQQVNSLVCKLLHQQKWTRWASLSDVLPLLAEAAPDVFLDQVEKTLKSAPQELVKLFCPNQFGEGPHEGLLQALGVLGWHPTFLARVTRILHQLHLLLPNLEPNLTTPMGVVRRMFDPQHPSTLASRQQRLKVIEGLQKRFPDLARRLHVLQLPTGMYHPLVEYNAMPQWRPWAMEVPQVTPDLTPEEGASLAVIALLQGACTHHTAEAWSALLNGFLQLHSDDQKRVMNALQAENPADYPPGDRLKVGGSLQQLTELFDRNAWDPRLKLPPYRMELQALVEAFVATSHVGRHEQVFERFHAIPGLEFHTPEVQDKALIQARDQAILQILNDSGWDGFQAFVLALKKGSPRLVGSQLGRMLQDLRPTDAQVLQDTLTSTEPALQDAGIGFVIQKYSQEGLSWLEGVLKDVTSDWPPEPRALLFGALPGNLTTWERLDKEPLEVQKHYWTEAELITFSTPEEASMAYQKLLEHQRPVYALYVLGMNLAAGSRQVDVPLMLQVLWAAAGAHSPEKHLPDQGMAYYVVEALKALEGSAGPGTEQMAQLELVYLQTFEALEEAPKHLHQALVESPNFFAEVVSLYEGKAPESWQTADLPVEQAHRSKAGQILDGFARNPAFPGGDITTQLLTWAEGVLRACSEAKCSTGPLWVGQVLSHVPPDEVWPPLALREWLEDTDNPAVEDGLVTGRFNRWGMNREDEIEVFALASQYRAWADALKEQWPRSSVMLTALARQLHETGEQWISVKKGREH